MTFGDQVTSTQRGCSGVYLALAVFQGSSGHCVSSEDKQ